MSPQLSVDEVRAVEILRRVKDMEDNGELTNGTVKFNGPGGVWTLRQKLNAKQGLNKFFRPGCRVGTMYKAAYSFKMLKHHLMEIHPVLSEEILASQLSSDFVALASATAMPRSPTSSLAEQPTFPGMPVVMETEPPPPLFNLPPLYTAPSVTSKFSLTVESVLAAATLMTSTFTCDMPDIFYSIPKGVMVAFDSWGAANIPLIVGTLPFPSIPPQFDMKQTWGILPAHGAAIEGGLTAAYLEHMRDVVLNCDVGVFEMYSNRKMKFKGGLILIRFDILQAGQHIPAICIESIVAFRKHKKIGKYLFNFCREMLFSSSDTASHGFIFSQCVDIPFWNVSGQQTLIPYRVACNICICDTLVAEPSFLRSHGKSVRLPKEHDRR
jgi:hypothetical protein